MALTSPIILSALQAARASGGIALGGTDFDRMAMGIAQGVFQWAVGQPQNLMLMGASVGSGGSGVITPPTTKIIVPMNPGVILGALSGAGVSGPTGVSLATVVAMGISNAFTASAQYSGVAPTVGVGSDTSKVSVSNGASLIGILTATLSAVMGAGPAIGMLSAGLGNGIAMLLLQGTGIGAITGVPAPYASSGVTTSVVM